MAKWDGKFVATCMGQLGPEWGGAFVARDGGVVSKWVRYYSLNGL